MRKIVLATALTLSCAAPAFAGQVPDGFVFASGGDLIGPYRSFTLDIDPRFAKVSELFRKADIGFANNEGSIFDLAQFKGYPAAENGGGYPCGVAQVAKDLKTMGITIVSKANNHGTDWGTDGLVQTLAVLKAADLPQAGSGLSEADARAAGYVQTRKGLAAVVSTASTFPPMSVAGSSIDYRGVTSLARPGISALHVREIVGVTADELAALRKTTGGVAFPNGDKELRIGDTLFRVSDKHNVTWEMMDSDKAAILKAVGDARAKANFVLFTIHAHQTAGTADPGPSPYQPEVLHWANEAAAPLDTTPANFEPELFRAAVDAGADAVVRTGPHVLNGIEIYKGKPIFYGLASLFYPFGQRRNYVTPAGEKVVMPDDCFESIVPVTTYKNGKAAELKLYPITIDEGPGELLGFPVMATPERGRKILERLQRLSAPFGTTIRIENGVGVIALQKA